MLEVKAPSERTGTSIAKRSDIYGDGGGMSEYDEEKVKEALARAEDWRKEAAKEAELDDRKRGYNSMRSIDVQPEDMEAYRLTKLKRDDPMAMIDTDTILEYKK